MKIPLKFINALTDDQINILDDIYKHHNNRRVRMRAHSILLSFKGYSIDEIADIYNTNRDSVSSWIDKWVKFGIESLYDKPRSGAPKKLTDKEIESVKQIIIENPQSPKTIIANILIRLGKEISQSTLKRIVKKANKRWKRMRKSLKNKRNQKAFEKAENEINVLKEEEKAGNIDIVYFDESGFSLNSFIPYCYQSIGETIGIIASDSKRLNVAGFYNPGKNNLESFCFECTINSSIVVECFNRFSEVIVKKTVVILDNSPIHHSNEFTENISEWEKKYLNLYYLPSYSPELNLIENLWRFIKYSWLNASTYLNFDILVKAVENILKNVGPKYKIHFVDYA